MNQFFNILVTLLLSTTLFGNAADSTSLDLNDITLTLTNFNKIFKHDEDSADSTSLALDVFEIHTQATNIQSICCIEKGLKQLII